MIYLVLNDFFLNNIFSKQLFYEILNHIPIYVLCFGLYNIFCFICPRWSKTGSFFWEFKHQFSQGRPLKGPTKHISLDLFKDSYFFLFPLRANASQAVQNLSEDTTMHECNTRHTWVVVGVLERPLKQLLTGHYKFSVEQHFSNLFT